MRLVHALGRAHPVAREPLEERLDPGGIAQREHDDRPPHRPFACGADAIDGASAAPRRGSKPRLPERAGVERVEPELRREAPAEPAQLRRAREAGGGGVQGGEVTRARARPRGGRRRSPRRPGRSGSGGGARLPLRHARTASAAASTRRWGRAGARPLFTMLDRRPRDLRQRRRGPIALDLLPDWRARLGESAPAALELEIGCRARRLRARLRPAAPGARARGRSSSGGSSPTSWREKAEQRGLAALRGRSTATRGPAGAAPLRRRLARRRSTSTSRTPGGSGATRRRRLVDDGHVHAAPAGSCARAGLLDFRTDVERYALDAVERLEEVGFENEAGRGRLRGGAPDELPSTREKRYLATGQRVWRLRLAPAGPGRGRPRPAGRAGARTADSPPMTARRALLVLAAGVLALLSGCRREVGPAERYRAFAAAARDGRAQEVWAMLSEGLAVRARPAREGARRERPGRPRWLRPRDGARRPRRARPRPTSIVSCGSRATPRCWPSRWRASPPARSPSRARAACGASSFPLISEAIR
ncbi:MAG: hypothetical protein MZU95_05265 [Desulfomicrobium escambiense]|nr:hypothetical protein [Desulfomicrobium escambiense]